MCTERKLGYTDLPREIRNIIMQLVLCPGIIYLRAKVRAQDDSEVQAHATGFSNDPHLARNGAQLPPALGVHLLTTCRLAYNEGRRMY